MRRTIEGTLLLVFSFLLFVLTVWLSWWTVTFTRDAKHALGVVVGLKEKGGEGTSYAPVLVYRDAAGVEHEVTGALSTLFPPYESGDTVEVLYLPEFPQYACINSFRELWGGPLMALIVCAMFAGAGVYVLRGRPSPDS